MKKPGFTDMGKLVMETRQTPMHLGSLFIFSLPKNAKATYFDELMEKFHTGERVAPPFNMVLSNPSSQIGRHEWRVDHSFDLDYHLRHIALPKPGTLEQLRSVVSRLHGTMLDRHRPLWETYIIEGLQGDRFAMFYKLHQCMVDGPAGVKLILSCFSKDPKATSVKGLWQGKMERWHTNQSEDSLWQKLEKLPLKWTQRFQSLSELTRHTGKMAILSNLLGEDAVPFPSIAPKTRFNKKITAQRRTAAHIIALESIKRIGKLTDSTMNDVLLAICSGALRKYLEGHNDLPASSLIGYIPVALQDKTEGFLANRITSVNCMLATNIADPLKRLDRIKASMSKNKELLLPLSMTSKGMTNTLGYARTILINMTGLVDQIPGSANLTIYNVAGPPIPLYFNGARLESFIPGSTLVHGQGLNITAVSYADHVCIGLVGCRQLLPDLNKLEEYLGRAFKELEDAVSVKGKKVVEAITPAKKAAVKRDRGVRKAPNRVRKTAAKGKQTRAAKPV